MNQSSTHRQGIQRLIRAAGLPLCMNSSKQRFFQMLFSATLGRGIMAIRQLVLVPVFLYFWNQEYYGEWLMLSAMPSFFAMTNLGLGTAASTQISIYVADQKAILASKVSTSSIICLVAIAIIASSVLLVVCLNLTFEFLIHLEFPQLVLPLLILAMFPRIIASSVNGWWTGVKLAASSNNWYNVLIAGELLANIICVAMRTNALCLAAVLALVNVLWMVGYLLRTNSIVKKRLRVSIFNSDPDFTLVPQLLYTGIGFQLSPLWQAMYFQGTLILVGVIHGPSGIAFWSALRIFIRFGAQLTELLTQSLVPEMQFSFGSGNIEKLTSILKKGTALNLAAALGTTLALLIAGRPAFNYWTGSQFEYTVVVWYLSIATIVPYALWCLDANFLYAINRPWRFNLIAVLVSFASLIVVGALSNVFGFAACAIGAIFFDFALAFAGYKLRRSEIKLIQAPKTLQIL